MRKRVRKLLVTGGLLALSVTLFGAHRYEKDEVTATPTLADLSHVDLSPAGSNEGRMLLYSHALARLNERLAHYPDDYEASLLKGIIDFKSGRLREARRQLASLIRRVPKFHLAYLVQGDLLLAQTQTVTDFGGTPLLAGLEKPDDKALEQLRAEAEARLNAYLDTLPQNRIPRALLALGRTVKTALVVDKQSHRLYVYRREGDGQPPHLVRDFYVSTGKLSGDKSSSGDMRTPEGVYFLTRHIPNSALPEKYGSGAYPLDYPNELDAHEAKTGEGIWLQGTDNASYSRPPQDSEGCVVLPNIDLDHVGAYIHPGVTPLVITAKVDWIDKAVWLKQRDSLEAALQSWARDWASGDVDKYLSHYAPGFWSPGYDYQRWVARKRAVAQAKHYQQVKLSDISLLAYPKAAAGGRDMVVVDLEQHYRSNNFSSDIDKRLYLVNEDGRWRVLYEGNQ